MTRFCIYAATLSIALCACDAVETSSTEQDGRQLQGRQLQGRQLQGMNLQGMSLQGIRVAGATLGGQPLSQVHVLLGEVVAQRGSTMLRGAALAGAQFQGQARNLNVSPPATAVVDFRITAVTPEVSKWDPTHTGHTFLYTLEQRVADTGTWQPACDADEDGRSVAIPLTGTWNEHGDRVESSSLFTFGCTTGVIGKCYRWGYRPWVTGYGDLTAMHETCTRLARADYCGIGVPGTRNGTMINVWDTLPSPGPIQAHDGPLGLPIPPVGFFFEAGWNTQGAVCLSHSRWILDDGLGIAALCPDRLVPPGLLGETVCDVVGEVLNLDTNARMFNETPLNLLGP
jgi:hypothetical protein